MTTPQPEEQAPTSRPISVAELLAKNEMIGAPPVSGRRRRRRGNSSAVTVAELTGEIPVIADAHDDGTSHLAQPAQRAHRADGGVRLAEPVVEDHPEPVAEDRPEPVAEDPADRSEPVQEDGAQTPYWSEPEPHWPESAPQNRCESGPVRSAYPRPLRQADAGRLGDRTRPEPTSGAEEMSPDPVGNFADIPVDVMDTDVREAEPSTEDSAYVRSYLRISDNELFSDQATGGLLLGRSTDSADSLSAEAELAEDDLDVEGHPAAEAAYGASSRIGTLLRGGLIVLQSILAVAFGAGLFIAFDQLWRWKTIVALALSVLVILGLVVGVRLVRKTEDIASTLIAVAVGALVTLGPLALLQSG